MNAKLKALLWVVGVLGALALALYLPAARPLRVQGISEGPSQHAEMQEGSPGEASPAGLQAPPDLAGLALSGPAMTGKQATDQISVLHGTGIEVVDGLMAMYGRGERKALLWVSRSADEADARRLLAAMDTKMPRSKAFGNHALRTLAGQPYHFVRGQGMDNYYWQQGDLVVWVGLMNVAGQGQEEVLLATRQALGR